MLQQLKNTVGRLLVHLKGAVVRLKEEELCAAVELLGFYKQEVGKPMG